MVTRVRLGIEMVTCVRLGIGSGCLRVRFGIFIRDRNGDLSEIRDRNGDLCEMMDIICQGVRIRNWEVCRFT